MRRLSIVSAMVVLTALCTGLIPCPECGHQVARQALMCPNCGLRGEIIAEAAKAIPETKSGDVLDVDCGGVAAFALPVEMSDGKFAVLPLDPVLGAAALKVSHKGREIGWMVPAPLWGQTPQEGRFAANCDWRP